ncbi:MAG: ATP-binding protein [Actinobacteria bacterium]|nr:ATP-binding protein [Actinomycetota bacterium]
MPCSSPDLVLDLPATPAAPRLARQAVERLPVDENQLPTVTLLASELVTNAVRHAGTDRPIRLEAVLTARRLRVCVTDEGRGFSPLAQPQPAEEDGGYGLFLVEQLANQWGVAGRTVWFELRRGVR